MFKKNNNKSIIKINYYNHNVLFPDCNLCKSFKVNFKYLHLGKFHVAQCIKKEQTRTKQSNNQMDTCSNRKDKSQDKGKF